MKRICFSKKKIFFFCYLQNGHRAKRRTHQTSNERIYGILTSSTQNDRQKESESQEFGFKQIFGHHMAVSISICITFDTEQ